MSKASLRFLTEKRRWLRKELLRSGGRDEYLVNELSVVERKLYERRLYGNGRLR